MSGQYLTLYGIQTYLAWRYVCAWYKTNKKPAHTHFDALDVDARSQWLSRGKTNQRWMTSTTEKELNQLSRLNSVSHDFENINIYNMAWRTCLTLLSFLGRVGVKPHPHLLDPPHVVVSGTGHRHNDPSSLWRRKALLSWDRRKPGRMA